MTHVRVPFAASLLALSLSSGAAFASGPQPALGVTAAHPPPLTALQLALVAPVPEGVCSGAVAPSPWADPSDAFVFATHPTAYRDEHELAATTLASLVDLRLAAGALRLFVLGAPARAHLFFSRAGWAPRWPFC